MGILSWAFTYDLDLDSESDIRISKPSDAIDHASIAHLGYEYDGSRWVEKAGHALARVEFDTDEEAEMDIPPPSPTAPTSPHSLAHAHATDVRSSSAPPNWYQRLSQRLDTMSLDYQQMHRNHQEDMREQACRLGALRHNKLRFYASCDLNFCCLSSLCGVIFVVFNVFFSCLLWCVWY